MKMHRSSSMVPFEPRLALRAMQLGLLILPISPTSLLTGVGQCLYDYAQIPNSESFRFIGSIDPCPKE